VTRQQVNPGRYLRQPDFLQNNLIILHHPGGEDIANSDDAKISRRSAEL
jgi:hypothetical protein